MSRLRIVLIPAMLVLVTLFRAAAEPMIPGPVTVLRNATVIVGNGQPPVPGRTVVVSGDRIAWVGPDEEAPVYTDSTVVELDGAFLMPGVINAHVHETASPDIRHRFALAGVTSLGLTGAPWMDINSIQAARDDTLARVFWCGPMISVAGGFPGPRFDPGLKTIVASVADARLAVQTAQSRGADFIKVVLEYGSASQQRSGNPLPTLTEPQCAAVVSEAKTSGLLVRAHVTDLTMVDLVLRCGIDVVDHVPRPAVSRQDPGRVLESPDPVAYVFSVLVPEYRESLAALARAGVYLVPTLTSAETASERTGATALDRVALKVLLEAVRIFHEAGGRIALGNDYPEEGAEVGMPLREMLLLQEAGLTTLEVITAATKTAAEVCGHGDGVGTIMVGKSADLLIVAEDPTVDLARLTDPLLVMLRGEILAGHELIRAE